MIQKPKVAMVTYSVTETHGLHSRRFSYTADGMRDRIDLCAWKASTKTQLGLTLFDLGIGASD